MKNGILDRVKAPLEGFRRLLVVLALCLWFGGFTFYSLVVIHTGHRVFESRVEVGFLTQAVTQWLNLIGIGALLLMLWNLFVGWSTQGRWARGIMVTTWLLAAGIEVVLFMLHPRMDVLMDSEAQKILSFPEFKRLHLIYINYSTVQWSATILYIWACLCAWRRMDRQEFSEQ